MYTVKRARNWLVAGLAATLSLATLAHGGGDDSQGARQAEFLDRGVVAVKTDAGVFVSWRLLGDESYRADFNLYRDGRKLNRRPLSGATNYLDAAGLPGSIYTVRRADEGRGRGCSNHHDRRKHAECAGSSAAVWAG